MGQRELDALVSQDMILEQQKDTTRRSLSFGMKQNPDEYAGAVKLGKDTGTSTDFALKYKNDLELKKRMQVFPMDSLVRETPRTAEFLSNPENAAIAHDDVESMSFIEKAIAKARDYSGAAVEGLVGKGAGSTLTGTGELYNVAVRNIDRLLDKVLPNSVMSALREPILPWYLDPAQVLIQPGKTLKATGEYVAPEKSRQGLDTDVISGIGQLSFQIGSYLVTGGGMSGTMLYAQGADVMAEKTKDDKADPAMRDTAIIAGAAITKLTEQYGLDKILNRVPPEIKNRTLRFLADKAAAGGIEAAQEITEGLLHDLVRKITTNENAPILEGALREGSAAGLSAAIVRAALGVRGYRQAKQQEELIVALSEGGKNSKLLQRMPEKYQELVANITRDGDINNVFIPVGQFNTFFQSQDVDPAEAATRYGATNYSEAEALGTDVVIPIEKFAAEVAPRDDLQGLLPDVKFRQGDRTARERQQDLIDEKAREEELIASAQASVGEIQTPVLQQIKTDMEGQLIATGMERTTAEANAIQYAKVINSFAVSEGIDPLELHRQYGLGVTRPLPDVLTRDTRADINIDPILDTLRNGTVATDEQIFGKSLVEFVREQGGIQPTGELLDADYNNRPFQRNLVQKDGLTADQIAERAIEAGYFEGKTFGDITEADIYDALDEELRGGNLTLAPKNFNEQLLNQRDQYNQLGDYLNSLGIDLRAITDNNQVRQLIQQAAGAVGLQDQVNQFFNAIEGVNQNQDAALYQRVKNQSAGKEVPASVDAVSNVESAFEFAGTQSFPTNRDFKLALQARVIQAAKDAGVDLEEFSQGTEEYLVRIAMADGITALRTNANAVGWYNEKVTKALRLVSLIHPEISTDPQAKFAFVWAMAVTSNGLKVDKNFELAEQAYESWKNSNSDPTKRVMPIDIGIGTASNAINKSMGMYNTLIKKHGFQVVEQFMTTMQPAGEVQKFTGQKLNGENLTTMVYGAAALGPKIGNGFFMNLYGRFEQLTMDRWLMRTWGRWTGTLVEINQAQIKSKRSQLKDVIKALSPADKKAFEEIIKRKLTVGDIDAVGIAIWKASQKPANRVAMAKIGVFDNAGKAKIVEIMGEAKKGTDRVSFGDEMRKVGNALTKYLDGQKEAPSGPPERGNIRKVFGRVLTELQKTHPTLTMSDYQALLWYPEKRLYDAAKTADEATESYEDNEAPDYANAAEKLARAKGISESDIGATIDAVNAELQAANSAAGVRPGERGSGDRAAGQENTLYQSVDQPSTPVPLPRDQQGSYFESSAFADALQSIALPNGLVIQPNRNSYDNGFTGRANITDGENNVGHIDFNYNYETGEVTINKSELAESLRGKGIAKAAYQQINQTLIQSGLPPLSSDPNNLTQQAVNLWKSLVRDGLAYERTDGRNGYSFNAPQQLYQSVEPTFYSALARAVEGAKQSKAPASDWLSIVTKLQGVKKEEIEATGLREYLELRGKEQVTKEEISDYLNSNGVQVEEVMLGSADATGETNYRQSMAEMADEELAGEADEAMVEYDAITDENRQQIIDAIIVSYRENAGSAISGEAGMTKYSSYTLPGGENYRELLLTLPTRTSELPEGYTIEKSGKNWVVYAPDGAIMASWPNRQEAIEQVAAYKGFGDNYRSSHWDQKNVIAHIRFNERTDADGNKVLFIEEIQSDWAQQGRQRGFKNNPESIMRALGYRMEKIGEDYVVFDKDNDAMGDGPTAELAMQRAGVMDSTKRSVPDAPFVGDTKAWVSLSIKRMIRYAAENGYSKVAFVNGQQSADRYDLSKQIKYLEVQKATKNKYKLYALDKSSEPLSDLNRKLFTADELSDAIGKDLAEKAVSQISETGKKAEFKGLELKVGGEGMIAFYDKIVPQVANDVLKKLGGGKVETVAIGDKYVVDDGEGYRREYDTLEQAIADQQREGNDPEIVKAPMSQPGFAVTPAMVESVLGGQAMFQGEGLSDKRGFIQFGAKRKFNIALLEKANLSTFLHETGHFYLEVMGDLAERADASDRIKEDYAKVLKYLGLTSRAELTLDGKAPGSAEYNKAVAAHETWARSNEAYLMEGKAPSEELRSVFQKFKSWLNVIYKELSALNVNLTNEIREVFDRMYATDAEIEQAKNSVITVEMFATAADMGVSEAEFQAYKKAVEQTVETGKEALQAKLMKDLQREQAEWWKKAKQEMRAEVEVEVDLTPVYAAFKTLTEGKLEDGTPIRLNKESLVEKYGEQYLKRLPRSFGRIYTREGGMDTESAAEFLGFESGDALIEALAGMKPRNEYIKAEVDRRMRERYGDMLTDGSISEEAAIALHNSQRENALMIELKALRRKQREAAPFVQVERNRQRQERQAARAAIDVPPASAFRAAAQGLIDQMAVRDLNPYKYLQASRRASKEASSALISGDAQLAGDAKQREILNHFMYLEATKAKEEADAILKYAQRFEKGTTREQMGKAGADYLEQIDAILDRYEFRRVPLSKIDKRKSLSDWIDAQEAQGLEPNVDPRLLNEARSVNYREISMGELRGIRDTVKNIEHLARLKNKLVTKRKEIEFKDAIAEMVASAENNGQRRILPPDLSALTMREKASDKVSRLDAQLLKIEQIVEWLDGGRVDGPWHTYLWNPIAQAQSDENDLHRTLTSKIVESLEQMPKAQRKSMLDVYDIPGIGKVTRKYIISMALNMGNQENIDKMMRGHDWSMSTIETALSKLSDEDWRFVQDTWNNINSLWPQIVELEKRMTGVAPKKVEAQPYTVRRNGQEVMTLEGGYFPLVYDPRFSETGAKQETGNLSQMFEQGYVRATTSKGHTEARKEGFAAPLQLDFEQVLSQHTAKVIKDLTHREAIVAANKILTNPEIRKVLQETLGTAYEQQMLPWLRSVVNDKNGGAVQGLGDFSRFMMALRANTVAAVMGFKATTAIMQITGLSASLDKVGKKDLAVEVAHFMRHPIEMTNTVRELSGEMRNRPQSLDRDIRGQLNMMIGNNSLLSDAQRFAFHGIAMADTMVTVPTWMAAYKAAIREGKSEEVAILEGDAAVRLTQGAGGAKDLSAVQRNNELMKALTMFYSYFNVLYNRMRDMGRDVQSIKDMPKFLSRAFFTVMIPAVMGDLIVGRGPDDEEDYPAWLARKVLMYPLMSIPLLRDIASSLESGYDYKFTPLASGLEKLYKLGKTVVKTVSDEKDMEWGSFAVKAAETIGYLAGVPGTAQVSATGKYLWRVSEGEEEADNFAELLFYAAMGKRKEQK